MFVEDNKFAVHGPKPLEAIPRQTLGQVILERALRSNFNDDFLVDVFTDKTVSYKAVLQESCKLAEALRTCGYSVGTVLSICSENNLEFFIPILASVFLGAIMAPINNRYAETEVKHCLSISKPKVIFCTLKLLPLFLKLQKIFDCIDRIIIIDSCKQVPEAENLTDFIIRNLRGNFILDTFQPFSGEAEKHAAFILYSSGTTGLPKGVLLSHYNMVVLVTRSRDHRFFITRDRYILGLMPFFHGYGLAIGIVSMANHTTVIVLNNFDEDTFLKSIEKYKISILPLAPPLAIFLTTSPKVPKYDLSSVTEVICSSAPLSKEIEAALKRRLNLKSIRQAYGLTETTAAVSIIPGKERLGSCGKLVSYVSGKVRDPATGRSLGPNRVGEICIKGPVIMMGYYNNEKATRELFTSDGWLRTGDLGYYDDEQYFYIIDRLKELIKYKGFQVAPAELESILLQHPEVLDVGVVGIPHKLSGEVPLAFIVKKRDHATEQEIQEYVAGI